MGQLCAYISHKKTPVFNGLVFERNSWRFRNRRGGGHPAKKSQIKAFWKIAASRAYEEIRKGLGTNERDSKAEDSAQTSVTLKLRTRNKRADSKAMDSE